MATVAIPATMGRRKNNPKSFFFYFIVSNILIILCGAVISTEAKAKAKANAKGTPAVRVEASLFGPPDKAEAADSDGIGLKLAADEKGFSISSYGAKSDGKKDNIEAFLKTYRAACDHPGKSRFIVPQGRFAVSQVIFSGPCAGPGPMVFQITGTIAAVTDVSMYPSPEWMLFTDHNGLVIFGGGSVDGQGEKVWKYNNCVKNHKSCARLASSIVLQNVTNASIRKIVSVNPMGFHFFVTDCKKIRMQMLHIKAPDNSPNTDGVHISSSDQVTLSRSVISTGDDCVGILQGSTRISVNNVICGPGHGISIGSLGKHPNEDDVTGVQIKNCTIRDTTNGVRIKTFPYKPNVIPIKASGFVFQDIILERVKNPIIIDQEYCGRGHSCVNGPSKIKLSDMFFSNIKGTTISPEAISIRCSSSTPCHNVHLSNIDIKGVKGPASSSCVNAKLLTTGVQIPPVKC